MLIMLFAIVILFIDQPQLTFRCQLMRIYRMSCYNASKIVKIFRIEIIPLFQVRLHQGVEWILKFYYYGCFLKKYYAFCISFFKTKPCHSVLKNLPISINESSSVKQGQLQFNETTGRPFQITQFLEQDFSQFLKQAENQFLFNLIWNSASIVIE